jgi:hypothetical protein
MFGAAPYLLHTPHVPSAPRGTEINWIHRSSIDRYAMNIVGIVEIDKILSKIVFCLGHS